MSPVSLKWYTIVVGVNSELRTPDPEEARYPSTSTFSIASTPLSHQCPTDRVPPGVEMSSRRRNGQAASCEPCRKDKVRCDHETPSCGRCQKRNITSRCFYHPAPLTRERDSPTPQSRSQQIRRSAKERSRRESLRPPSSTPSSVEISIRSPETDQSLPPGYFGPTSFVSAFSGGSGCKLLPSNDETQVSGNSHSMLPSYWVPEMTKLLGILSEVSTIEQLVHDFYGASQSAILPTLLTFDLVTEMRGILEKDETPQTIYKKTTQILESTAQNFQMPPDIKGKDFHGLFRGTKMRLEIIGLVYAIAGRSCIFGLAHDRFPGHAEAASAARFQFARRMLTASNNAIHVCKLLTPVNDMTSWLLHENMLLSCMLHGDSSKFY